MSTPADRLASGDPLFFLHVPKAAGSSLREFIRLHFDEQAVLPVYHAGQVDDGLRSRFRSFSYYGGHFRFGWMRRALGRRPVAATMLRHPIERFVSLFAFSQLEPVVVLPIDRARFERLTIEDYLADSWLVGATQNIDPQTGQLVDDLDEETLRELGNPDPCGARGRVETACRLLDSFEFVGITERFEESLLLLCYTLRWRPPTGIPRVNVTRRRPRLDSLSPATLQRIADYNRLDAEVYDHAARLFDRRFREMLGDLSARYGGGPVGDLSEREARCLVYEWLDRHYRDWAASSLAPLRHARVDFSRPPLDPGWHLPERAPEFGHVCWTGPGTVSSVDLPLSAEGDARLRFRVIHALAPDLLDSLRLRVNDIPLALERRVDERGASVFEAVIPGRAIAAGGITRLSFQVSRTLVPAEVDATSLDRRALGLAFNWIEVAPA